jgi:hypothetical protein
MARQRGEARNGNLEQGSSARLVEETTVVGFLISCLVDLVPWVVLWLLFWRALYQAETREEAVHFVTTADGWRLALSRYPPPARAPAMHAGMSAMTAHRLDGPMA